MNKLISLVFILVVVSCSSDTIDVYDAARKGNLEVLKKAHAEDNKSIDVPNKRGHTPLILACYRGQPEATKLLINLGVNINYACDLGTALHAAVYREDFVITEILLKNNIDINAVDSDGITALIMAVNGSSPKMVELLLKYNPDRSIVDAKGETAFVHAMERGNEEIIQLLKN
jgi:hypothetical protein